MATYDDSGNLITTPTASASDPMDQPGWGITGFGTPNESFTPEFMQTKFGNTPAMAQFGSMPNVMNALNPGGSFDAAGNWNINQASGFNQLMPDTGWGPLGNIGLGVIGAMAGGELMGAFGFNPFGEGSSLLSGFTGDVSMGTPLGGIGEVGGDLGNIVAGTGGTASAGSSFADTIRKFLGTGSPISLGGGASPLSALISGAQGIYGLAQGRKLKDAASAAASRADPFGAERGKYQAQLSELMRNPDVTKIPGYEAGIQAVNRGMAAGGYLGSGNQMTALQKFGGEFYDKQIQNLMRLAGADIGPGNAGALQLEGNIAGTQLTGQSINRLAIAAPDIMRAVGSFF